MDIASFQRINAQRGQRWHQGDLSQWSPLEWAGAMCGEAGEAANAAKKLRRLALDLPNREAGIPQADITKLEDQVAKECADTIIYALLLMSVVGRDAAQTIAEVFDQKSIEYGFPERAHTPHPEEKKNISMELHRILGEHGVASLSRHDQFATLHSDLIHWAADACRQSRPLPGDVK